MKEPDPFKIYQPKIHSYVKLNEEDITSDATNISHDYTPSTIILKWRIFIALGILLLFARLMHLQIINGEYYQAIAENNRIRTFNVKAPRGIIFDRNNNILAENVPKYLLEIIPIDLPQSLDLQREIIQYISNITNKNTEEIQFILGKLNNKSYEPVIIDETLDFDKAIMVKIQSFHYPGVMLEIESKRKYNFTDLLSLSHVIGYLGGMSEDDIKNKKSYDRTDTIGKIGIEYEYEDILRGNKGKKQIEVDALGKEKKKIAYKEPRSGDNLILTLDTEIQFKLEESLQKALTKSNKKRGVAIALDPNNGEVLALISLPSFDNNIFTQGMTVEKLNEILNDESRPLFNRAIYGTYPSGSTIKPVIAAAALQEGIVTEWTQINSVGGIRMNQWYFPDWKKGGHGPTNITKALAESVNTYFYYIGGGYEQFDGLGLNSLIRYFSSAGLGSQTGIDLPGESEGFIPTKEWKEEKKNENWYIGDTYHLAIGQGDLLVTPLQVANWTAMVSNGGILYQPHLVKKIVDANNTTLKNFEKTILKNNIFLKEHLDTVKRGLRDAVIYGSAKGLNDLPITIAGKTGTAQWSTKENPHAWFTSFAPYPNPKIVVTILIEEGGEGSQVAVPVAKDFYTWWAKKEVDK